MLSVGGNNLPSLPGNAGVEKNKKQEYNVYGGKKMKLHEIFNQDYVLVETEYGVFNIETSYDEDDYCFSQNSSTTLANIKESAPHIYHKIVELGAEGVTDEVIFICRGTVTTVSGTESCTVYAPSFWQ